MGEQKITLYKWRLVMQNIIVSIASKIALDFLKQLAQSVWDALWGKVIEGIQDAEKKYSDGTIKKEWVIQVAMDFIESHYKMTAFRRWAVKKLLNRVIDSVIGDLNGGLGKNWIAKIEDLKKYLGGRIPLIN
jgi:hypothetical protein